jgi:hypothetical protein
MDHCGGRDPSIHYLEDAGGDHLRYSTEQCSIGRDGERAGTLYLRTSRLEGAESGNADADSDVHSVKQDGILCGVSHCAAHG